MLLTVFGVTINVADAGPKKRVRGEAFVAVADDLHGHKSEMHYMIKEKQSQKYLKVKFRGKHAPDWFKNGLEVEVEGEESASGDMELVVDIGSTVTSDMTTVNRLYTTDNRSVLTLLVTMNDGSPYLSKDTVAKYMFGSTASVAHLYLDSTAGKVTFDGDPDRDGNLDIYSVKIDAQASGNCSYTTWGSLAEQQAKSLGVDLTKYKHFLFVLPSATGCSWGGIANLSGPRAWVRAGGMGVFAHELGHNLGMHHASTDTNNDGTIDSEYGDYSCPMGYAVTRYLNAPHMYQMGVFSAFPKQIANATAGTHSISALGLDPTVAKSPQIFRLAKTDTNQYYFISMRAPYGYDKGLSTTYLRGLSIHKASSTGSGRTMFVKSLAPGETFTDAANGISITALDKSTDLTSMNFTVNAVCGVGQPSLTLSNTKIGGRTGDASSLSWTLTNNDNANCPATTFTLSASSAAGVTSVLSKANVTLDAGASTSGTLTLSSSNSSGTFSMSLKAEDTDGRTPTHTAVSAAFTYYIDNVAPTAVTNLASSISKDKVTLTWSAASDSLSGVAHYVVFQNGVRLGTTTSTSFTHSGVAAGTYTYSVQAVDNATNVSALSSVSVTVSTTTKTKGGGNGKGKIKDTTDSGGGGNNGKGNKKLK